MPLTPGQTLTHYEILGLLGAGGMGEVYLARDTRLGRQVAIKVLPETLRDDPDRRARFLREARAVAHLTHPNIAQILDVGEADGADWIAFELVEGQTLAERLTAGGLGLDALLDLALPLADALAYAHERGILHRDLKTANVMITERGHPKLLDFGLAKMMSEGPAQGRESTQLTVEGAVFGTPGAMSPEQALGRSIDARSDVFSFGTLIYETAAGRPAFEGGTVMEVVDAVIHREPVPLASVRPELPGPLVALVEKALRKEPGERYQTVSDLAADLRHVRRQTDSGLVPPGVPLRRARWPLPVLGLLTLVVLALAWMRYGSPSPPDPRAPASSATLATTADGGHVAVLYFENKADPADADQLGDMLTHLLTTELAREPSLSVLSQQRLFETARRTGREDGHIDASTASDVAQAAGVSSMVLGRLARAGSQWLASASVVETATGRELATGQARGAGAEDVFAMAEELGRTLRDVLGATGRSATADDGADRVTTSVEAYREFLGGVRAMQRGIFVEALEHFGRATELDAAFAQAWYWDAVASGWAGDEARQARSIERAQAFSERLPPDERRTLPAAVLWNRSQYVEARPVLEALVAEDPRNRDAWYMLGEVYLHSPADADPLKAADAFERVLAIDPEFQLIDAHLVHAWLLAGDRATAMDRRELALRREGREGGPVDEGGLIDIVVALWSEDLEWTARIPWPPRPTTYSLLDTYSRLLHLQAAIARDDREDPAWAWAREQIRRPEPDAGSSISDTSMRGATLHQMLVFEGDFDGARELAADLLPLSAVERTSDLPAAELVDAYLLVAGRLELRGAPEEALAVLEEIGSRVAIPRAQWQAVALCLRLGREARAAEHVEALLELVAAGTLRTGYYLELARAELALAGGDARDAVAAFERALDPERAMADNFAGALPGVGRVLDGLWRAVRATGDEQAELEVLRRIVERPTVRAWDPITWRRAQAELGMRELEGGDAAAGRARLEDFLAAWGTSGAELPEVRRARAALGS